jgi:hypothetical protein
MNSIERYIYAVVRHLPEKQRHDVAKELQAEIELMVEDQAKGKRPSERHAFVVLQRLGDPLVLAGQYYEQKHYLISPRYYDSYIALLKTLAVVILPILAFFVFTLQLSVDRVPFGEAALSTAGTVVEAGVHIFFWITLSVVFVDRVLAAKAPKNGWSPEQLPEVPRVYEISKREAFVGAAWSIFGMALLVAQIPAVHGIVQPHMPLFFAPALWPWWLIGFIGIMVFNLAVELLKLQQGGWTKRMAVAITVVNTISAGFFIALLLVVYPIANPEFTDRIQQATNGAGVADTTEMGIRLIGLTIIGVLVGEAMSAWIKYNKGKKDIL